MTTETERTYTLAEVREKVAAAMMVHGSGRDNARAFALSFLPDPVPPESVTVTEEMVDKATVVYGRHAGSMNYGAMRDALESVAADLAQPVHACQHKAQWWVVRRDDRFVWGTYSKRSSAEDAINVIAPQERYLYRIVGLAEVSQP